MKKETFLAVEESNIESILVAWVEGEMRPNIEEQLSAFEDTVEIISAHRRDTVRG